MKYNQYYNKDTMNLKQLTRNLEKQAILVNYPKMAIIYACTTFVT